jgi:hypothetical protein
MPDSKMSIFIRTDFGQFLSAQWLRCPNSSKKGIFDPHSGLGVEARERVAISVFGDVSWTGNRLSTTMTCTFLFWQPDFNIVGVRMLTATV